MSSLPIIDPNAIKNLRALSPGDNDEFLREIIGLFVADMPERLAELEDGLRDGDVRKFTRAAHSIKGSASNLGAATLGAAAERLEQQSNDGRIDLLAPMIPELREAFAQAKRELELVLATR